VNEDGSVDDVTRVVLGLEQPGVAEEVMHFLDRGGRARVVATASDERQLAEAVRQLEPDAIVASPGLARLAGSISGGVLLALDTAESVRSLRGAIRAELVASTSGQPSARSSPAPRRARCPQPPGPRASAG
jgi:DNA-binding NarL/FixJ family response regulator